MRSYGLGKLIFYRIFLPIFSRFIDFSLELCLSAEKDYPEAILRSMMGHCLTNYWQK